MSRLYFYYGVEYPAIEKSKNLKDYRIVIQPYHPLAVHNQLTEYFPLGRVFIYFNCLKVSSWEYQEYLKDSKVLYYDEKWKSYVLDLEDQKNYIYLSNKAKKLLGSINCHGLFLDDLDCSSEGERKRSLLNLLKNLPLKRRQKLILNRGFGLWDELDQVESIVLESFVPEQFPTENDLSWMEYILDTKIEKFKNSRGDVDFYIIKYACRNIDSILSMEDPLVRKIGYLSNRISKLNIKSLSLTEGLNVWSSQLC